MSHGLIHLIANNVATNIGKRFLNLLDKSFSLTHKLHKLLKYIYRPPPSRKNKLKMSDFIDEFDTFLADVVLTKGKLIIMGDLNFHLDETESADCNKLNDLLETYGLQQRGNEPIPTRVTTF